MGLVRMPNGELGERNCNGEIRLPLAGRSIVLKVPTSADALPVSALLLPAEPDAPGISRPGIRESDLPEAALPTAGSSSCSPTNPVGGAEESATPLTLCAKTEPSEPAEEGNEVLPEYPKE